MRQRVTIVDVAARAGVSISSVSSALNDRPGVSAETRARIKQTAAEFVVDDPRVPLLRELGLPAVGVNPAPGFPLPAVRQDDDAASGSSSSTSSPLGTSGWGTSRGHRTSCTPCIAPAPGATP